ncbi:uncharacterized protein LOC129804652 [Phlebotomus papatasi]|uniref:uncharacterized protein LOC129804652 n=1 Tax=Phlebotomus papatasi TaxID=29031 RepID=UPI002483A887|nr:uncharacterized protein LOC129804652 [Phlebotomus papatasi]
MGDEGKIIFGGELATDLSKSFSSLGEMCYYYLNKNRDKSRLIDGVTGRKFSFGAIKDKALHLAEFFRQVGIKEGDVIGICCENRIEFTITMHGAYFVGATIVPINYLFKDLEMIHIIQLTQPKIIFGSEFAIEKVFNTSKKFSFVEKVIQYGDTVLIDGIRAFEDILKDKRYTIREEDYVYPKKDLNRNAIIALSSGTTGLSKGVQITESNLMATLSILKGSTNIGVANDSISLSSTPWSQALGFITQIRCVVEDFTVIFIPRFEERLFLNCIEKYKVTHPLINPHTILFLAKSPLVMEYDLSSLQILFCGGAPLSKELAENIKLRLPNLIGIRQGYGLSETFLVIANVGTKTKPGSVGTVLKGTYCKVVDPATGKSLGPNEIGELYLKSLQTMKGYIGNDAATEEAFDPEGWLRTGDLGYYDEDEFFFIVDRIKEVIKYRALQVPPVELEALLLGHPKIADAGVTGIPNEADGEHPIAFVVKKPNEEITEQEIKDYIANLVIDIKRLRGGVRFVNSIPKNAMGKILRRELKKLIEM